jgi:hypothetical protein
MRSFDARVKAAEAKAGVRIKRPIVIETYLDDYASTAAYDAGAYSTWRLGSDHGQRFTPRDLTLLVDSRTDQYGAPEVLHIKHAIHADPADDPEAVCS